jgi:hypothetical protein
MPMFQEPAGPGDPTSNFADERSEPISIQHPPTEPTMSRKTSEESIRTELCDGPIPDSPKQTSLLEHDMSNTVSDRAELIERLKRGESPTWVPNRHVRQNMEYLWSRSTLLTVCSSNPSSSKMVHVLLPGVHDSACPTRRHCFLQLLSPLRRKTPTRLTRKRG